MQISQVHSLESHEQTQEVCTPFEGLLETPEKDTPREVTEARADGAEGSDHADEGGDELEDGYISN